MISPHLDDAVFSCGAAIAASRAAVVCTIRAGALREALVTDWDTQSDFANAHQAMHARRAEVAAALDALDPRPLHLDLLDSQYAGDVSTTSDEIASALIGVSRTNAFRTLLIPLSLFRCDHYLVHAACHSAWRAEPMLTCIAYEDALYRRMRGPVQLRLDELAPDGITATPVSRPIDADALVRNLAAKQQAVSRYASQLRAFRPNGYDDVFAPERFWTLQRTHHDR
ncbi:PIG-L family deacetylase [Caballeronia novacaledonica]|uniref:PIG-L family deacetylase n=1 Tax=Caballeronia novacaledonica TaxID=1544861 RepID=A0ACB5QR39_9BURK|nr:PIG-L family deacetylase [Caballeronia novacaledonica]